MHSKGFPMGRYCPSEHLLEWNARNEHSGEAWSRLSECWRPERICECHEAEHRNAWGKLYLQQAMATGCWSAELRKASHKTVPRGRRQVLKASADWSALLWTSNFATLDQCSATGQT